MEMLGLWVPKFHSKLSGRTYDKLNKVYGWKVVLSEIIWRLQVQSQLQYNKEYLL